MSESERRSGDVRIAINLWTSRVCDIPLTALHMEYAEPQHMTVPWAVAA